MGIQGTTCITKLRRGGRAVYGTVVVGLRGVLLLLLLLVVLYDEVSHLAVHLPDISLRLEVIIITNKGSSSLEVITLILQLLDMLQESGVRSLKLLKIVSGGSQKASEALSFPLLHLIHVSVILPLPLVLPG